MDRAGPSGTEHRAAVRAAGPGAVELLLSCRRARPPENLALMRAIDEQYLRTPFYGSRKHGEAVRASGRERVQRLMRLMGITAIYPKRRTTWPAAGHKIYPYLLRNVAIERPNQVWSTDITYVPLRHGFVYLVAVMDWYSRYVLAWRLSNTLDGRFCLEALEEALAARRPEIFNSDQGSQFTAAAFTGRLENAGVAISMDGRGRALGQRLHRAAVVEREARGGLPEGVCDGVGGGGLAGGLLSLLLSRADPSGVGLSDASRGVFRVRFKPALPGGRKTTSCRAAKKWILHLKICTKPLNLKSI